MKEHFWQGEWIDGAELERRIASLPDWIAPALTEQPRLDSVLTACDSLARELSGGEGRDQELKSVLVAAGASDEEASELLQEVARALRREELELKLKRELGSMRPFMEARSAFSGYSQGPIFESWAPLGFLVHVSPQNSPATGTMSVLEGLLSGNVNFLKIGAEETLFPQTLLSALADKDDSGWISRHVIAARISSRRRDLLTPVFNESDGIAAWGGEDSIAAIRNMAPAGARVIEWGHKISFIYVAASAVKDANLFERIARECCLLDQQACSSPQCVYVETEDFSELEKFGESLALAMEKVSGAIQRVLPGDAEAAELSMTTRMQRLEAAVANRPSARVFEAPDRTWRVLVDSRSELRASPLFRSIWVKPLPREKIAATLRPMRMYLQTAGLECALGDACTLSRMLKNTGVQRIRRIGSMLESYAGEPHDGVYALQRYCRRTSVQLGSGAGDLSNFQELQKEEPLKWRSANPPAVTAKEAFTSLPRDAAHARLYFKTGGSTGEPKLSTYDYDQYHEQMRLGADGMVAAGFDPLGDRAMNLFFGGNLYGGFLSVFSTLELLEAVQFPMAGSADFGMVAQTIVKNNVNALLGMPSYLMQLFEKEADTLSRYRGLKKIFYGGEHFSEAQLTWLREKFNIELIRSLAYGSVDIGPIGYQCRHCEGGVHHLHHGAQFLEILRMDEDRAVAGDEVGRLVFSPRALNSNKPLRYELGDVGHWVGSPEDVCACGRRSPRFKLLGRCGDIFRIGSMFLNYQKLAQICSAEAQYSGELQLILSGGGGSSGLQEKLVLIVTSSEVAPERLRELCLSHYADLREAVLNDRVLGFEVQVTVSEKIQRTSTGKLRHVIDERR